MGTYRRMMALAGAAAMVAVAGLAAPASVPGNGRVSEPGAASVHAVRPVPSTPLKEVSRRIATCRSGAAGSREGCTLAVYLWSPRMPLSELGVEEVSRAAASTGVELLVVDGSELEERAATLHPMSTLSAGLGTGDDVVVEMLEAGATIHFPALLLYRGGVRAGGAILGYKTADAYRAYIDRRMREPLPRRVPDTLPVGFSRITADSLDLTVEYPVSGRPGAYFRAVAGRQTLAYEASSVVRLLHLADGSSSVAPGHIDFVPTPDGRFFVTPAPNNRGLEFYDAAEVFEAAERGEGREVEPVHVDRELRDQYPSVGILESETNGNGRRTIYRVLTSWFDRIAFRDYEVREHGGGGDAQIRPLGPRTFACPQVSLPILGPNARELAGRDEASATTRIFRIGEGGDCREVADTGLPTGKVAWSPDGGRIAFAIPRGAIRDGRGVRGTGDPELAGIFVFDRRTGELTQLPGSRDANRLAFPEFVGSDSLVYLLSPPQTGGLSVFRLVCCVQ